MEKNNDNLLVDQIYLQGIYGETDIHRLKNSNFCEDDSNLYHNGRHLKVSTNETVESYANDGLPEGITKDDYFRIALLNVLRDINDNLKSDKYVSVKDVCGIKDTEELKVLLKELSK